MTKASIRLRATITALALPVGGLALSYALLIDYPLRQNIRDVQTKIAKVSETVKQRQPEQTANLAALEQAQQAERELSKLVSTTVVPSAQPPIESSDSPVVRLAAVLAIFDRHDVRCIGSQPYEAATDTKQTTRSSQDSKQTSISLEGRFCDVHSAIAELQSSASAVAILSVRMEPVAEGSSIHRWVLILQP